MKTELRTKITKADIDIVGDVNLYALEALIEWTIEMISNGSCINFVFAITKCEIKAEIQEPHTQITDIVIAPENCELKLNYAEVTGDIYPSSIIMDSKTQKVIIYF